MNNLIKYTNWLKRKNLAPATIRHYLWTVKQYGKPKINTQQVTAFIKRYLPRYQAWTWKGKRQALLSYAQFQKKLVDWARIKPLLPKIQGKFFSTINQEELKRLKQITLASSQALNERNNRILDFLFYSGIRVAELVNIKHPDWQGNQLRIHGKGNKIRYVFLPDFLTRQFKPHSSAYLFATRQGGAMEPGYIRRFIHQKTQRAGLNKIITPHTFRRSFATILNNRGARLTTIQKLLGHAHITTTANYIHNDFNSLYEDYSRLWRELSSNNNQYAL